MKEGGESIPEHSYNDANVVSGVVMNVVVIDSANPEDEKKSCREVVSAINAFIKEEDYKRVA